MTSERRTWAAVAGMVCVAMGLGACQPAGPQAGRRPGDMPDEPTVRRLERAEAVRADINLRLSERVISLDLDRVEFHAALERLGEEIGVPIVPVWPPMEAMGVTRQTPVSLRLRDVSARVALNEVLGKASGMDGALDYAVDEGAITVSAHYELERRMGAKVHDVRDILEALAEYERELSVRGAGRAELVCAAATQPDGPGERGLAVDLLLRPDLEQVGPLIELIRRMVTPGAWAPAGDGLIEAHDGLLVVRHDDPAQRQVALLLGRLRAALADAGHRQVRRPNGWVGRELAREQADRATVLSRLERRLDRVDLRSAPLEQALDLLAAKAELDIVTSWGRLEQLGILRDSRVTVRLTGVTVERALEAVLGEAARRPDLMGMSVEPGLLRITTVDEIPLWKRVELYNVRDLLAASDTRRQRLLPALFGGRLPRRILIDQSEDSISAGLFGSERMPPRTRPELTWRGVARQDVERLLDLIRGAVQAEFRTPLDDAVLFELGGLLVVWQTDPMQREVGELLARLRLESAGPGGGDQPAPVPVPPSLGSVELVRAPPPDPTPPRGTFRLPGEPARLTGPAADQPLKPDPDATVTLAGLTAGAPADRVVYVVDISESMAPVLPYVKLDLLRSIDALKETQRFQVVFFADGPPRPLPVDGPTALCPATAANKQAARQLVQSVIAHSQFGQTDPGPGLKAAVDMPGGPPDVLFLVSDGLFTEGAVKEFAEWSAPRTVRVYTVGMNGGEEADKLLEGMARRGGGEFLSLDEDGLSRR